jgi:hypothetical protein
LRVALPSETAMEMSRNSPTSLARGVPASRPLFASKLDQRGLFVIVNSSFAAIGVRCRRQEFVALAGHDLGLRRTEMTGG